MNFAGHLKRFDASCCKKLVVKGGKGFLLLSFLSMFAILYSASLKSLIIPSDSFFVSIPNLGITLSSFLTSNDKNLVFAFASRD